MTAQEIRLGNYLNTENGVGEVFNILRSYVRVFLDNDLQENQVRYEDLKPIPITKQWLLDFGFNENSTDCGTKFYTKEFNNEKYCDLAFIEGDKNGILEVCLFPYENFFRYQYVHEIQNLYFALTKKELIIKAEPEKLTE